MDILLDPETGDLALEQDDLVFVEDEREVEQEAVLRVTMFKGESFLDPEEGLVDRDKWFANNPSMAAIRDQTRKEVLKVDGAITVASPELTVDGEERSLTISVEGTSNRGPFSINTETP